MKICLAGSSVTCKNNRFALENCDYILESFYYIKDWQLNQIKEKQLFLLDSGAFTFMNNSKQKK